MIPSSLMPATVRARAEISLERQYRAELRQARQQWHPRQSSTRTGDREEEASSLALRAHPTPELQEKVFLFAGLVAEQAPPLAPQVKSKPTCEGLNLSSVGEVTSNKALQCVKREISLSGPLSIEEQKQILPNRGLL